MTWFMVTLVPKTFRFLKVAIDKYLLRITSFLKETEQCHLKSPLFFKKVSNQNKISEYPYFPRFHYARFLLLFICYKVCRNPFLDARTRLALGNKQIICCFIYIVYYISLNLRMSDSVLAI
jgi:hypothetical protein